MREGGNTPSLFLFLLSGSLALVSEPNSTFYAIYTISFGNVCTNLPIDFSRNMWYYILVKRETDTQSKRTEKTETKKFLKIFKKSLDKQYQVWYNKNVAKRYSKKHRVIQTLYVATLLVYRYKNFLVKELIIMSKKMTIVEQYESIVEKYADILTEEEVAFLKERAELHAKKNGNRKPTAQQLKNKAVAEKVVTYLTETREHLQIKEMIKKIPCFAEIENCTPQYVMAIIRPLHDKGNGIVQREEIKGTAYFYIPAED